MKQKHFLQPSLLSGCPETLEKVKVSIEIGQNSKFNTKALERNYFA